MKIVISLLCFFSILVGNICSANFYDPVYILPVEFKISKKWFSWNCDFDVETTNYAKMFSVQRRPYSYFVQYDLFDPSYTPQAVATMHINGGRAVFDITDGYGRSLGQFRESYSTFFPHFELISSVYGSVANLSINFWGTTYTIVDPNTDYIMATLSRPFFGSIDNWTVNISDPELFASKGIDYKLFVLGMTLQTDYNFWSSIREDYIYVIGHNCKPYKSKKEIALLKKIENELESCKTCFASVQVNEDDFVEADKAATLILSESTPIATSESERTLEGIEKITPLLYGDELSIPQKSALSLLIRQKLKTK